MTDVELSRELSAWFSDHLYDKNKYRSVVWQTLEKGLNRTGNWKVAARGNPREGYVSMKNKDENDW